MSLQGVLSWVGQATPGREPPCFEARLYDRLFNTASVADTGEDWLEDLNPESLIAVKGAMATPKLAAAAIGDKYAPFVPFFIAQALWAPRGQALTATRAGVSSTLTSFQSSRATLTPGRMRCRGRVSPVHLPAFVV